MTYPTTLPCPSLPAAQGSGESFLRTEFEFDTRQRGIPFASYTLEAIFFCTSDAQMAAFRSFFHTGLLSGSRPFDADWVIEGSFIMKQFRFSQPYKVAPQGEGQYTIKAVFDMLTPIKDL